MLDLYVFRIIPFGMFTLKVPSGAVSFVACVRHTCTRLSLRIVHHFLESREVVALFHIQDRAPVGIIRFARNVCNIAAYMLLSSPASSLCTRFLLIAAYMLHSSPACSSCTQFLPTTLCFRLAYSGSFAVAVYPTECGCCTVIAHAVLKSFPSLSISSIV